MKDHEVYSSQHWAVLLFCRAKGSGDSFAGWPCPVQAQLCLEILAGVEWMVGTLQEVSLHHQKHMGKKRNIEVRRKLLMAKTITIPIPVFLWGQSLVSAYLSISPSFLPFFSQGHLSLPLYFSIDCFSWLLIRLYLENPTSLPSPVVKAHRSISFPIPKVSVGLNLMWPETIMCLALIPVLGIGWAGPQEERFL